MGSKGWISVHRKIQEHWIWEDSEPFDKRSAWIDILLLVNHRKKKFLLGSELVEVDAGERITSERKLAKRWNWSRTKVRNFLELLKKDQMIEFERKPHKRTRLKVLNYSDYQGSGNHKKTSKKPQENQSSTSGVPAKNLNNNDNNDLIMNNNENKKEEELNFQNFFENNSEEFKSFMQQMSKGVVLNACKISVKKDSPLAYCKTVLEDWEKKGIQSVKDLNKSNCDYRYSDHFIDDWDKYKE